MDSPFGIYPTMVGHSPGGVTGPKPQCGGGNELAEHGDEIDYQLGLHVVALFVILLTSVFGVMFPIMARRYPGLRIPPSVFTLCKHFGSGVILATAFIHALGNECLPDFWLNYSAAPGAIAMSGVICIFLIEFAATRYLLKNDRQTLEAQRETKMPQSADSAAEEERHLGHHHLEPAPIQPPTERDDHGNSLQVVAFKPNPTLGVTLLEAGIIFHSLFIGLTLAIATGSQFISLFITIIFHQMFEGLGLGSRIALLPDQSSVRVWLMGLAYALTTPIGIAIGMGVRYTYDSESATALIVQGFLDGFSAGLLLYAALVELLAHEWIYGDLNSAPQKHVYFCISSFIVGVVLMSLLGKWA